MFQAINSRGHAHGLQFMSLPELLPATHALFLITFAHLSQQTLKGRQGWHEHPHFIGGEAEAGPSGADGPRNLVARAIMELLSYTG